LRTVELSTATLPAAVQVQASQRLCKSRFTRLVDNVIANYERPDVGAPLAVAPTYREAAVAPVSPVAMWTEPRITRKVCTEAEDLSAALVTCAAV